MRQKGKVTVTSILIGDDFAKLVAKLDIKEANTKLMVIQLGKDSVRVAVSPGVGKLKCLGALYEATRQVEEA